VRRADARVLARQAPVGRGGFEELDHAVADRDDGDHAAARDGRQAAGLAGDFEAAEPLGLVVEDGHRVGALVAHEDAPGGDRGVVRLGAGAQGLELRAVERQQPDLVDRLHRDDHRAGGGLGDGHVARRAGQVGPVEQLAAADVAGLHAVGLAGGDERQPRAGVDRHALGAVADVDHAAGGRFGERRGARGLGGAGCAVRVERAAGGESEERQRQEECGEAAYAARMADVPSGGPA
jgi:hypothetical protein